jgi:protein translocase SEC61 complex gamma subunit
MLSERANLGLRSFLKSATRLLRLAKKPGRSELWLSTKICLLGVLVVGALAFLIKLISSTMQGFA